MKAPDTNVDFRPERHPDGPKITRNDHVFPVDGVPIACTVYTPTTGETATPVIFVHGGGASSTWWHPVVAGLAPDRAIATIDLSGHGRSGWRTNYTYEGWAHELATIANSLFPHGCALVGHSLGGAICWFTSTHELCRVTTIVSFDGNPAGPPPGRQRPPTPATLRPRTLGTQSEAIASFIARKTSWPPDLADYVARDSIVEAPDGWRMRSDARTVSVPVTPSTLDAPAGVRRALIVGERSPFSTRDLADADGVRGTAGFTVHIVPGVGHELIMEHAAACARTLHSILEEDR